MGLNCPKLLVVVLKADFFHVSMVDPKRCCAKLLWLGCISHWRWRTICMDMVFHWKYVEGSWKQVPNLEFELLFLLLFPNLNGNDNMWIWSHLFLQIFCSLDTSILLQLSNWFISWGTSRICMVVVECCQLVSLRLFPNNPTSSSDSVSIYLLQWSCQVCWLSTVFGYLMGSCICLKFESTYAMALGSRICK